jgi:hypothetical protein
VERRINGFKRGWRLSAFTRRTLKKDSFGPLEVEDRR